MFIHLCLMLLLSMAETVQKGSDLEEIQATTSTEMATKFYQNTKEATLHFRETMKGFDKVAWNKEMSSFDQECQRGFSKGFEELGLSLSKSISKNQIDTSLSKLDSLCAKEMKKQKGMGLESLHFNIGCIMGGQMRIYQRLQLAST
jgi:hypothetical protein